VPLREGRSRQIRLAHRRGPGVRRPTMARRRVNFEIRHHQLRRQVRLWDGRRYTQTCSLSVFEDVAWNLQEHLGEGVSANGLWRALAGAPLTQVHVALDFLLEKGCLVRCGRRSYGTSPSLYEDALGVFHYLAEVGP